MPMLPRRDFERPAMDVNSPRFRQNLALAVGGTGALVAWLTSDPSPLVVTVAAVCLRFGDKIGLAVVAAMGLLAFAILFLQTPITMDDPVRLASFLVAAFGVWLLIWIFRVGSFNRRVQESTRAIIEKLPGLGWSADATGRLRYRNPASLEYEGLTFDQMKEDLEADKYAWTQSLHPDDVEKSLAKFKHSIATGEPLYDESRARKHDGTYRWFRDVGFPTRDETGKITGWYGTSIDIDDQKKAEEALRQSERELRLLVDTVPSMIYLTTPDGRPYYYNKRFVDWIGADPGGKPTPIVDGHDPLAEVLHPDDRETVQNAFYTAFAKGEALQYKSRLRRKDGEFRWLESRIEPLRDDNGTIIRWYGVNIDIDDEVRAQEALRLADERLSRASRAASLSELSVSIAHELNSPLQAVVANANAFQRWLGATPPNYERASLTAARIIRDANAAAEVISRIRALFAQTEQGRVPTNLNGIVTEVCDLVADRLQSSGLKLELDLEAHPAPVFADRVQIEQVVLNLVRNAIEAMQDAPQTSRLLRITSRNGDGVVEVEVTDRGHGIPDPERIFDAFYTTKKDGMGMGLAICRSIIESHEGRIGAKSVIGEGSSVGFSLPIHSEPGARVGQ
jgi:PAS domain S-box-containing protein